MRSLLTHGALLGAALVNPPLSRAQQTAPAPAPASASALVFDGVTVVDVEQGKLLPGQRVVIAGNRIRAMGTARGVTIPAGAQVVDARGKYLIPGLWDMRTHLVDGHVSAELLAPLFVFNGVTGIRNAWSYGLDAALPRQRDSVLAGTAVGPPRQLFVARLWPDSESAVGTIARASQGSKAPTADLWEMDWVNFAVMDVARASRLSLGGALLDAGKFYGMTSFGISAATASDSGLSLIEHIYTSGGLDTLCWGATASVARCQPVADRLARNGSWLIPTLLGGFTERWRGVPFSAPPGLEPLYTRFKALMRQFQSDTSGVFPAGNWLRDPAGATPAGAGSAMAVIQQLAEFPLLAGTDGTWWVDNRRRAPPPPPGFGLHEELAMYVATGLSPLRALQAATLNPAKFLHATDSLGTVAPGKLADLVLLDANPLEDITNTTAIQAVVANGRYYDRAALDALWRRMKALAAQKKLGSQFP